MSTTLLQTEDLEVQRWSGGERGTMITVYTRDLAARRWNHTAEYRLADLEGQLRLRLHRAFTAGDRERIVETQKLLDLLTFGLKRPRT